MEPLPLYSYLTTPFSRALYTHGSESFCENSRELPDPYLMFCLRTKLQPLLPNEVIYYSSILQADRMNYIFNITNSMERIILPKKRWTALQESTDTLSAWQPDECLLFEPSMTLTDVPIWYQSWMISQLTSETLQLKIRQHPITHHYGIFSNSSGVVNFSENYEQEQLNIITQLRQMYTDGWILCSPEDARRLKLSVQKQIDTRVLAVPDWDTDALLSGKDVVMWLLNAIDLGESFESLY